MMRSRHCRSMCIVSPMLLSGMAAIPADRGSCVRAGLFWLRSGASDTLYGSQNANGLLFFEMMFVSMRAMLSALFTFPPNFKIMLKVSCLAGAFNQMLWPCSTYRPQVCSHARPACQHATPSKFKKCMQKCVQQILAVS